MSCILHLPTKFPLLFCILLSKARRSAGGRKVRWRNCLLWLFRCVDLTVSHNSWSLLLSRCSALHNSISLRDQVVSLLIFLHNELVKLASENDKHLLTHNLCESGIQDCFAWVPPAQSLSWGWSQSVGQGFSHQDLNPLPSSLLWLLLSFRSLPAFELRLSVPQHDMWASPQGWSEHGSLLPPDHVIREKEWEWARENQNESHSLFKPNLWYDNPSLLLYSFIQVSHKV